MNERIFELAKQADLIQWDTLPSGAQTPDHESVVKAKKFAELIVEECGRVADVFCHIWCEEDKPQDVTVSNYIKRHVLRADPE